MKVKDDDLLMFLENVYPEMEAALQSNETLDIFQDDFNVLPKRQGGSKESAEISNSIKETKNLFYLACKGKKVSCIQFQPWVGSYKNNPIIAESFIENLEFDQRVIFSMKSSKSVILFWNYEDMHAIDPLLVLTSPLEVMTFEFNPKDPSIIIAGTINGQIMMWDLKGMDIGITSKKKVKKSVNNSVREVQPVITSVLQDPSSIQVVSDTVKRNVASHKAPITCIKWFPPGLELDMKKNISTLASSSGTEINQFASISTDGQVLLWEKKFLDAQKKPVTDVNSVLFSSANSLGKQATGFICSAQKEEARWEGPSWSSRRMKRGLCLLAHLTKANSSCATGLPARLMRLGARTRLSLATGTKRGALGPWFPWTYSLPMRISS